jgi:hypothetical protein
MPEAKGTPNTGIGKRKIFTERSMKVVAEGRDALFITSKKIITSMVLPI